LSVKLHRWTDLLAALLRRRYPVPLEDLLEEIPAYRAAPNKTALRRAFERDKEELRSFGVPIETVMDGAGEVQGYRLKREHFYLPYLSVAGVRNPGPKVVDRDGFRALERLAFEPDELIAVEQAARRVEALGEPGLAEHARSALRKLAVDLPVGAGDADGTEHVAGAAERVERAVFDALDRALTRRKQVSLEYRSMTADAAGRRTLEPFGLFFLGHHWYLAARTPGEQRVKTYRLSRIGAVEVNEGKPGTPDYEIPPAFRLREYARSRHAWELGDGDSVTAEVVFATGGAAVAAARLGEPIEGDPTRRRFQVRRPDAFVRWLLSLGGSARPVAPDSLVAAYEAALGETIAVYTREGS
jgi:proteasome accessory factor B